MTSEKERKLIKMVEKEAISVLTVCLKHGYTSIISNGTKTWIDSSMKRHMPRLRNFLSQNGVSIRIISARDEYWLRYPDKYTMWKAKAFIEEVKYQFPITDTEASTVPVDLIIIGDGRPEKDSAKIFIGRGHQVRMIRSTEGPSCGKLAQELRFIHKSFPSILYKYGEMNLSFLHD